MLQYYAMERFLYRLSQSAYSDSFTLKGALMLKVWSSSEFRPTRDIDLLGRTSNDVAGITAQIAEILASDVQPDGLSFDPSTIEAERIVEDAEYEGIRIRFRGSLTNARIHMLIDIGFGDVVYPFPEKSKYPTLLDFPAPRLFGYSRESVIAEKLEAMVKLGELNSRMKDFYDIWMLSNHYNFEGASLGEAIQIDLRQARDGIPR